MPYTTPAPLPEVDLHPGGPPILHTDTPDDAPAWAAEHRQVLRTLVTEHGAVLIRGLRLCDAEHAGAVLHRLAPALMSDKEAFAPRRTHTPGVYSSSTWPSNQPMCMHHELSYTLRPPGLMLFACLTAPTTGGATAVADASAVLEALPTEQRGLPGATRGARRHGRAAAPGRVPADRRGERRMTTDRSHAMESVMSQPHIVPPFAVISGAQVQQALQDREKQIVDLVEATYHLHAAGESVNPPSYFLRFPDRPSARIIALPASIGGPARVDGLKWISSFPDNVQAGIPRASAVLILNDHDTGYPFACLESSIISATRTAASAALAADHLTRNRRRPTRIGFIGTGLIARYIHTFLTAVGWSFDEIGVHDLSDDSAAGFRGHVRQTGAAGQITVHGSSEAVIRSSDLIVFATIAGEPHISDPAWFGHNPLVLHVSLRDLAPEIILASANIVDDVDHCLKADTSPHLAEQLTGNRDFLHGTLADVMTGRVTPPTDRPLVFSPFGLGVLDLAVGKYVYDETARSGDLHVVEDFFHDLRRHG